MLNVFQSYFNSYVKLKQVGNKFIYNVFTFSLLINKNIENDVNSIYNLSGHKCNYGILLIKDGL